MSYKTPVPDEIKIVDRYGDERVLTQRYPGKGYQLKRNALSPSIVLTKEVGVIVGQRVKAIREQRGWTLADLCIRADIRSATPKQRMFEIESSTRREGINIGTVYSLALALDCEITDLLPTVAEMKAVARPTSEKRTVVGVVA